MNKFLIAAIILAVCIGGAIFLSAGFNGADMCGNDIKQSMLSPDGKLKAVIFSRDCGATTGYTTAVAILDKKETLPNTIGNVFWLEEDDIHEVRLEWKSNKELILHNTSMRYWIDEHPRISTQSGDVWLDVVHRR